MDRFEAMSILVAVAEAGSLTAAGRRLNMPLPTVSRKLADLEAHLGARLLARSTRKLALTDIGRDYLAASKRILGEMAEAEQAAKGEHTAPRGELVIAAPIVFGRLHVLPIVNAFLASYPEIRVRLVLSDRNAHLLEDHVDLAVRIGVLADSSMIAARVGTLGWVVCASPDFLARHGTPRLPQDLANLPCITFDMFGASAPWVFGGGEEGGATSVMVSSRLSVNTAEAAVDSAVAGIGLTRVISYQAARAVGDGVLNVVLDAFAPPRVPVYLLHAAQGALPLKIRSFMDFAAPRLRAALAAL
jgi:DNA-binding transcriptional LysR family regulator